MPGSMLRAGILTQEKIRVLSKGTYKSVDELFLLNSYFLFPTLHLNQIVQYYVSFEVFLLSLISRNLLSQLQIFPALFRFLLLNLEILVESSECLNILNFPLPQPSVVFPWNFLLMNISSLHQHPNSTSSVCSVIASVLAGIQLRLSSLMEGNKW